LKVGQPNPQPAMDELARFLPAHISGGHKFRSMSSLAGWPARTGRVSKSPPGINRAATETLSRL